MGWISWLVQPFGGAADAMIREITTSHDACMLDVRIPSPNVEHAVAALLSLHTYPMPNFANMPDAEFSKLTRCRILNVQGLDRTFVTLDSVAELDALTEVRRNAARRSAPVSCLASCECLAAPRFADSLAHPAAGRQRGCATLEGTQMQAQCREYSILNAVLSVIWLPHMRARSAADALVTSVLAERVLKSSVGPLWATHASVAARGT